MSPFEAKTIRQRLGLTKCQMARILRCKPVFVDGMESGYYYISKLNKKHYHTIERLGEIALARRPKLDWSL